MKIQLRMTRQLYGEMRRDLLRQHAFAGERVGFVQVALSSADDMRLLLLKSYQSVPDDQYINDPMVGARINSAAIRNAMQGILDGGEGRFHVHLHPHRGQTRLSRTDQAEIPRLVNSFRAVGPNSAHGLLVLTYDHCLAIAWLPGATGPMNIRKIAVVGYPMEFLT